MRNLTYFYLNTIFFMPLFLVLFGYFFKSIKRNAEYILYCSILGGVYFFIVDPFATMWGAWQFNYDHTVNVLFGYSVLEELVWAILVFCVLAIVVSIFAELEEKNHKN